MALPDYKYDASVIPADITWTLTMTDPCRTSTIDQANPHWFANDYFDKDRPIITTQVKYGTEWGNANTAVTYAFNYHNDTTSRDYNDTADLPTSDYFVCRQRSYSIKEVTREDASTVDSQPGIGHTYINNDAARDKAPADAPFIEVIEDDTNQQAIISVSTEDE